VVELPVNPASVKLYTVRSQRSLTADELLSTVLKFLVLKLVVFGCGQQNSTMNTNAALKTGNFATSPCPSPPNTSILAPESVTLSQRRESRT
jgi:hypothetical protein